MTAFVCLFLNLRALEKYLLLMHLYVV